MFKELTEELNSFLDMGVPFYDCIVMKDGKCVYRQSGGFTDPEKTETPTGKEIYNIYSCTKLITCVAALQLWEKGLFSLEDKLSDYMPEFANMTVAENGEVRKTDKPILIENLFTMTAGFSYWLESPQLLRCKEETDGKCPTRETMKYLAKEPLIFEPGARWEYSLCHDVLAALVEVLTGERFGEYVKKNIFEPLGMKNSTLDRKNFDLDKLVDQYRFDPEKGALPIGKDVVFRLGTEYESGGAGAISTVDDYIKLLESLRVGDVILKKETVDLMATDRLTAEQAKTSWGKGVYGYGLGQRCPLDGGNTTDFGWGGAAGAYYAVDRQNGITVYLGTHILGYSEYQGIRGQILPLIQKILS